MALGDAYITNTEFKAWTAINDSDDDTLITSVCAAASESVRTYCQRDFNKTATATARTFRAATPYLVRVDDFHTTTDLVIKTDTTDDGTYDTTWTSADYVLEPFDGVEGSVAGFPYRKVVAVESLTFPCGGRPNRVQVTAQWGWNAVPESVKQATKIVAALMFNLKDSPLGVASFTDGGIIRVRDVPQAAMLLQNYRHPSRTSLVG